MGTVVLFDLFGTLVHFRADVPKAEVNRERWRVSFEWLQPLVSKFLPEHSFDQFLEALVAVTNEIATTRAPEYCEVSSLERFRRALSRLGVAPAKRDAVAPLLVEAHMAHLIQRAFPDPSALSVLQEVRSKGSRTGLVSNFDHAPAAYGVLEQYGLLPLLDTVVVSAEFGRRKPHPSIFLEAVNRLRGEPERSWFVGDHYAEDVLGARSVGLQCIWVQPEAPRPPTSDTALDKAVIVVRSLGEVPEHMDLGKAPSAPFPEKR
ncbi:MAG: hypothetical protein KatS3mg077_0922 [Candidatus Binatia bacterium]|nr:MAG: hypothetical protein KatS3mg077_0922 [Candidatus Binatia bacterium]